MRFSLYLISPLAVVCPSFAFKALLKAGACRLSFAALK